ncbi:hypothetical protein RvY_09360 [Ramazzottius varieornatus]|uniref:RNA helicase n=1 Tax=Ramazzottius varieornatus TaxID=947166 RepID=A0A1D1VB88_RAMVA|nr:hypothetical protein RvY_09360 [Ramazzottius varieornatus]
MMRAKAAYVERDETDLYRNGITELDEKLPIFSHRPAILDAIEKSMVVLVHGATGSGKTTQIPQYILDAGIRKGQLPNIIVTQPRRIAAVSIARHVCHERRWELGGLVGYRIAQDSVSSQQTRILYCTQGVFLEMMKDRNCLSRVTHIVLDEMHEREEEMDLALLLMRKLVLDVAPHHSIKLIVMSATMEIDKFSTYLLNPPVIAIQTRMFSVEEYYLDDLPDTKDISGFSLDVPGILPQIPAEVANLIDKFDDYEEETSSNVKGVVLIFVSGLRDIQDFTKLLIDKAFSSGKQWVVLPLHSTVSRQDQDRVFAELPPDTRRIIVSTNIAESSVTIPDVKYVIDLCLTKQMTRDERSSFTSLRQAWTSKSSCDQRKGRAGRLSEGMVFRMVPRAFFEQLPSHTTPEMLRIPLHRTILRVKVLDIPGRIHEVMADALDPPDAQAVERSVLELMESGALSIPSRWSSSKNLDGQLTSVGRIMSNLPLDIPLSRLVILSIAFGCVEEGIQLAACLASRSFWDVNFGNDRDKYRMKMVWDRGYHSDLLATLNAFQAWERNKSTFRGKVAAEREWCKQYLINYFRINETKLLYDDLYERVERLGLYFPFGAQQKSVGGWDLRAVEGKPEVDAVLLLQLLIAGAFYPNYFLQDAKHNQQSSPDVELEKNALVLTVQPNEPIYAQGVKNWFGRSELPIPAGVEVDEDQGEVRVTFDKDDYFTRSDVPLAVYFCLKLGTFKDGSSTSVRRVIEPPPRITGVLQFQPRQVQIRQTKAPKAEFRPVEFSGPHSNLLLEPNKFHGITRDISYRQIRLSNLSVNSVIINTADNPSLRRMLVSSAVSAAEAGDHLYLEDSTLMPALPGFNDLVILLLAPDITFLVNDKDKVVKYRAGLGTSQPTPSAPGRSFWKDHDIERSFDVDFTRRQIFGMQKMRDAMRLCFEEDMLAHDAWRRTVIPKVQDILRGLLQWWVEEDFAPPMQEPPSFSRFHNRSSAN